MSKAAILIDGAYLEMLLIKEYDRAQVDYHKLARELVLEAGRQTGRHLTLLRTLYYHALPWAAPDPSEEELERVQKKQGFFHRLEFLPCFEVKLGRTLRYVDEEGYADYEQQGVDVLMVADMVSLAARGMIEHLILLAPHSSFVPVIRQIKDMGVIVHLVHAGNMTSSVDLRRECDERIDMDPEFIDEVRRSHNTRRTDAGFNREPNEFSNQ